MLTIYSPPADIPAPDFNAYLRDMDLDKLLADEEAYTSKLQEYARKIATTSKIAGEVVMMPYADGRAVYIIVQVNGKHGLMTVPTGDAWRDYQFESLATVKYLTDYVAARRR